MKRREFLAAASSFLLPVQVNGLGFRSHNRQSALVQSLLHTTADYQDRILVMIYLNGGNDGLNTVIPLDQYGAYQALRSNIALPQGQILPLPGTPETGLHPAMTGLRDLYGEGKLAIIHSVSYPNPNLSHYRSTDIWMTATDTNQYAETGWAGRYLDQRYPGYPGAYPNAEMEDPLALQIGYLNTTTLLGPSQSMGINIKDPNSFYQLMGSSQTSLNDPSLPCCEAGELTAFIRQQQALAVGYAGEIKRAADAGRNIATYPAAAEANNLAEQLKIVARLIHGGLKTKIYFVELHGFDTHATQVVGTDTTTGSHAVLLRKVSSAIYAFQRDLEAQGVHDKVVGMTFSDFGRRANSNASQGTDHGVAAPMFVFGSGVKRRVVGLNPDLTNGLLPVNPQSWQTDRDIKMQIDFRRVYRDVLADWFGTSLTTTNTLLFRNFNTISLFSDMVETVASGNWADPAIWSVNRRPLPGEYVKINNGHSVRVQQHITVKNVLLEGNLELAGNYTITVTG